MRNTCCLRYIWAIFATTYIALVASLQATPSFPAPQAFVKVNQLYFLYTYPIAPYLNKSGVLMVGLEGMGRGLFDKAPPGDAETGYGGYDYGHVTTDASARAETLALGGHTVTFTAGSRTAQADGRGVPMGAAAVWDAPTGHMVVPASGLARCLGLPAHWDPHRRVLSISGPDVLTLFDTTITQDPFLHLDWTALTPSRVTRHPNDAPRSADYVAGNADRRRLPWLMIEMRNVSGLPTRACDLNAAILYSDAGRSPHLEGRGNPKRRIGIIASGGVWRYPLALQTTLDGDTPLCVVSCPVSSAPMPSKAP